MLIFQGQFQIITTSMSNLIFYFLYRLISIYEYVIVIYALSTWFKVDANSFFGKIKRIVFLLVNPYIGPIAKLLPGMAKMFSVLIGYLLLELLKWLIVSAF